MEAFRLMPHLGAWGDGQGPRYQRLAGAIGRAIAAGRLPPGTLLPAERPLAAALGVSRTTVVCAYELLREQGSVESRRGSGSRVCGGTVPPPGGVLSAAGGAQPVPFPGGALPALPTSEPLGQRGGAGAAGALAATGDTAPFRSPGFFRGLIESSATRIDFLGAHLPAAQPFVAEAWAAAAGDLAEQQLHHGYLGLGLPALRAGIAGHLSGGGLPTTPEQVLVTSGAQQAIGLLAAFHLQPGDAVALEDPTYPAALEVFNHSRARLLSLPAAAPENGLERLFEIVRRASPRLLYLIPSFHNPTGSVMPAPHRLAVAQLAAATGTPVVEDLTLADLNLDLDATPPPIAAAVPGAPVITVGSLSKLAWAGLRVGWVRAEAPLITRLARFKVLADLGTSVPAQLLAARLLPRAGEIREARRREVRELRDALERELAAVLPDWTWLHPAGGLCLWVRLPWGSAEELARLALSYGVAVVPGPAFSARSGWESHLRLPYTLDPPSMREGISRLAAAWAAYRLAPRANLPSPVEMLV